MIDRNDPVALGQQVIRRHDVDDLVLIPVSRVEHQYDRAIGYVFQNSVYGNLGNEVRVRRGQVTGIGISITIIISGNDTV